MLEKMIKRLREYKKKFEYLIPCFYFVFFFVLLQVVIDNKDDRFITSLMFCLMLADVVLFFRALKRYLRKRHKELYNRLSSGVGAVTRFFRSFTKKIAVKLGLRRNLVYIKGRDKIEFAFGEHKKAKGREEKKHKPVFPKWKDLKDNRERVRFIYIVFIKKCIKRGFHFDRAMTPADISKKIAETPAQQRVFACYNDVRYSDERIQVSDSVVKELLNVSNK